jgi:2Fe-2S ferredoxin
VTSAGFSLSVYMINMKIALSYTNSSGTTIDLTLPIGNQLQSLMEIVRDYGYEDWGECRGRAWCRTCHVRLISNTSVEINPDEEFALNELEMRFSNSRLACQIAIDSTLDGARLIHVGDD